jgi:hypothetical protein
MKSPALSQGKIRRADQCRRVHRVFDAVAIVPTWNKEGVDPE